MWLQGLGQPGFRHLYSLRWRALLKSLLAAAAAARAPGQSTRSTDARPLTCRPHPATNVRARRESKKAGFDQSVAERLRWPDQRASAHRLAVLRFPGIR